MCLIALGLAGVVVILLRFIVGFLIWLVLISLSLASVVGTAYVWYMWRTRKKQVENLALDDPRKSNRETEVTHWFVGAIFATIFTVIFLLIIIIMRKRIELVSALFKEAGKALATMPLLLFQPVVTFITLAAIVVGWFVGYLYIHTAKDVTVDPETDYVTFHLTTFFRLMKWYHLFALFWFTQFVISCQHVVIAGAVATWFFTRDKKKLSTPILTSLYNLIRYHLGSVALGSFVVALLKLIRAIFKCLERHMKKHPTWCNTAIKCCSCCLWCFEKFLIFLNRNAFIEIAIYGYPFCKAAQKAFHLLSNNILRVAAINSVGDFVLLLGKAGVTVATAFIGLELIKDKPGVNYTWVPVTVACIFAFLVSHCFLGIYEMAIDTLFLCFCEDCERNDGINKPYYMSRSLMVFVEDSKKVLEAEKNRRNQGG
ncbi:choline transporter-like protein 1 [Limulus polyphemus]|uniref:Choline transporter-like protein n=1 Tax=Limulus polyphemus TaxID=6850 RepID=A0ABM1SLA1_LIMPO|nr:choline transporter-like protein 1 [Limulus polyphemus]